MLCCLFGGGGARAPTRTGFLLNLSFTLLVLVDAKPSSLARVFHV